MNHKRIYVYAAIFGAFMVVFGGYVMCGGCAQAAELAPINGATDANTIVVVGSPTGTPMKATTTTPEFRRLMAAVAVAKATVLQ